MKKVFVLTLLITAAVLFSVSSKSRLRFFAPPEKSVGEISNSKPTTEGKVGKISGEPVPFLQKISAKFAY